MFYAFWISLKGEQTRVDEAAQPSKLGCDRGFSRRQPTNTVRGTFFSGRDQCGQSWTFQEYLSVSTWLDLTCSPEPRNQNFPFSQHVCKLSNNCSTKSSSASCSVGWGPWEFLRSSSVRTWTNRWENSAEMILIFWCHHRVVRFYCQNFDCYDSCEDIQTSKQILVIKVSRDD